MASSRNFNRSDGYNKASLVPYGFGEEMRDGIVIERPVGEPSSSLRQECEPLTLSKRLMRNVSLKSRKEEEDGKKERRISFRCLGLHGKGGGCKVGADTCEDSAFGNGRRKSNVGEECEIAGSEEMKVDCFWRRNSRKAKEIELDQPSNGVQFSLPDDILEMCLVRVSFTTLMNVRLVCKKWRSLTTSPHFLQMRCEGSYQTPWLFLFGIVRNGYCSGRFHALDVALGKWHQMNADILKGRFLFSVASIGSDVYVVGGCSSLSKFGMVDKTSFKTHKGVMAFSPSNGSWHKIASMKVARSVPILGIFEVSSRCLIFQGQQDRQERLFSRSRLGGESDIYEDPHRFSLRRQQRDASNGSYPALLESRRKLCDFVKHESDQPIAKGSNRFALIVVGGRGSWDEPLDSGEIYDPISNKWTDIARLPEDFGIVCSGAVCNGMFYVCSQTDKLAGYDMERGVWIAIQTAHAPPRLHEYQPKLVCCNNRLFMLCVSWCERFGQTGGNEKAVRKLWELDLTSIVWTEVSRHPDAPMDWNAAFVADGGRIFGVEMFKIFGQVLDFFTSCDMSDSELKWSHISRKHVAKEADASSCTTKSVALMYL